MFKGCCWSCCCGYFLCKAVRKNQFKNYISVLFYELLLCTWVQLNNYEIDQYFLPNFQCMTSWFTRFVRFANMKLFCKSESQNKYNVSFTTFTKHMNNQINCYIALEENLDLSCIHLAVTTGGHYAKNSFTSGTSSSIII